jgi:hypothetical protein
LFVATTQQGWRRSRGILSIVLGLANAAWLVLAVMAFNLTCIAGIQSGSELSKATTGTIRRELINLPARVRVSGRHRSSTYSTPVEEPERAARRRPRSSSPLELLRHCLVTDEHGRRPALLREWRQVDGLGGSGGAARAR